MELWIDVIHVIIPAYSNLGSTLDVNSGSINFYLNRIVELVSMINVLASDEIQPSVASTINLEVAIKSLFMVNISTDGQHFEQRLFPLLTVHTIEFLII